MRTEPIRHQPESQINTSQFQVLIEQDEDGYYVADIPALQGCHTQGRTFEEALTNIQGVFEICVEELIEEVKNVPNTSKETRDEIDALLLEGLRSGEARPLTRDLLVELRQESRRRAGDNHSC